MKKLKKLQSKRFFFLHILRACFWFSVGAILATFLFVSLSFFIFRKINSNLVYPGITIRDINIGKYSEKQVEDLFENKNKEIENTNFTFAFDSMMATISAKELQAGYNHKLISKQAIDLGRSNNFLSNISIVFQAYFNGINLEPSYQYSEEKLEEVLAPFIKNINKDPIDALFKFQNGKVLAFRPSENGIEVNVEKVKENLIFQIASSFISMPKNQTIQITTNTLYPKTTTDKANNLGIKELIGKGTSLFYHSIPGRIFNVTLAASKINGILIAPNEIFSFVKALGEVSALTGYKPAYVIQNGKTVLGDGGGVCQVSTTFFRALLNAGLPISERHAHAYRVGYYEQDGYPGIDATVYAPSVDLKFKNDTGNYILVQTLADQDLMQLTVFLYGTLDGREVVLTKPIITNRVAPPPDLYQDDSTLPKGTIKQIDFAAEGSKVTFKRDVIKNGKKIISENFVSNYAPWQSIFLRGTKE